MKPTTPEAAFIARIYARRATYAPRDLAWRDLGAVVACCSALADPGHTAAYRAACADCAAELLRDLAPDLLPQFLALTFGA